MEKDYEILKQKSRVCDGWEGPKSCIYYKLRFKYLSDGKVSNDFNPFSHCLEEYTSITGWTSKEDAKSYFDSFLDKRGSERVERTRFWVDSEMVYPLAGFLKYSKKKDVYTFEEYFKNDPVVRGAIKMIPNAWCASELGRLLSVLTYCWD
jgi:hypothetical protein